jgi:predicted nucleic acid-binding protein
MPDSMVDAHILLRFLQGEPPAQAAAAEALFRQAEAGGLHLVVHPVVLAEIVYVATSPHGLGLPRTRVANDLRALFQLPGVTVPEAGRVFDALRHFKTTHLDWADCVLLSYVPDRVVYTFDRAMQRYGAQAPQDGDLPA